MTRILLGCCGCDSEESVEDFNAAWARGWRHVHPAHDEYIGRCEYVGQCPDCAAGVRHDFFDGLPIRRRDAESAVIFGLCMIVGALTVIAWIVGLAAGWW